MLVDLVRMDVRLGPEQQAIRENDRPPEASMRRQSICLSAFNLLFCRKHLSAGNINWEDRFQGSGTIRGTGLDFQNCENTV